jgi:vitamin B12 transporter
MLILLISITLWESSGIIITAKRFEDLPYHVKTIKVDEVLTISNLGEFLEKEVGIKVSEYGSPGSVTQITSLGSSPKHTLILLNGHRISDPRSGSFDLSTIPLNSVKKIEIIRGPSSVFLGSNAVGGIVNFITEGKENNIIIKGNSLPGISLNLSGKKSQLSGFLNIEKGSGDRNNSNYERYSSTLSWKGFNLLGTYRTVGLPGPVPEEGFVPEFGDSLTTNLFDKQTTKFIDLSYQGRFGFGDIGIVIAPDIRWELMEPESHYSDYFTGDIIDEYDKYTTFVAQLDAKVLYKWFTLSLHLEQDTIFMHQFKSNGDTNSWYAGERNIGLSLTGSYDLNKVKLFGSSRIDWYRSFGFNPSVSFGVRYSGIVDGYLSFGTAFRAPTLNDLYWPFFSNENLNPEHSVGINIGIERGGFSLSGYIQEVKDRIGYGSDWIPYNIYKSRIYGIDIGYEGIINNLSYSINYSYLGGYDDLDTLKRDLQYQPKHTISGIIRYIGSVNFEISGKLIDLKKKWFDYPGEWKKKGPYLDLDASIEKTFGAFRIGFGIENILNEKLIANFGNSYFDRDYQGLGKYYTFWLAL